MRRRGEEQPDDRAVVRLNGRLAARWARRTVDRLKRERMGINAINVFPVADGDTGSNLYHTVRSAYRAVEELEGTVTLPEVVGAMATGALRGARGNSGLILSVALRGVADSLAGVEVPDAPAFAAALELAAARAREAIATPVDGTMVTVLDAMAAEARARADAGDDLVRLVEAVRDRSREALRETTGQLPVLRENQVVDAGSSGIVELFDLLYLTVTGMDASAAEASRLAEAEAQPQEAPCAAGPVIAPPGLLSAETGLELVAHLGSAKDRSRPLRRALAKAGGGSIVVSWPMVHVHTASGGGAAEARALFDVLDQHTVMDLRIEDLALANYSHGEVADGPAALIALADGPGLMLELAMAGAVAVRSDRSEDLCETVRVIAANTEGPCFVLPDSHEAYRQLREQSGRSGSAPPVRLIRTHDTASVLAATAVFDPGADPQDLLEDMVASASGTRVGVVVLAAEPHVGGPLMYSAGDPLTLIDGRLRAVGTNPENSAFDLVHRLLGAGGELVTLITGAAVDPQVCASLRSRLQAAQPHAEVVVVEGGQDTSWMVVGVE